MEGRETLSEGVAYARRRETGLLGLLWEEAVLLLSETTVVQYTLANVCLLSPAIQGLPATALPILHSFLPCLSCIPSRSET